jgi:deoxyadenosine/deoxycytidine kinase
MNPQTKNFYISVSGVMGSGKTTFANLLAKELGFPLFEEKVNENPYLADYYQEPHRWAFKSQLFYLEEKISQLREIQELLTRTSVIQDTPVYQDCFSYAHAQKFLGYMTDAEYAQYLSFFASHLPSLPVPHLIIQLDAPVEVLEERIQRRARSFEKTIDRTYLQLLAKLQNDWIAEHSSALNILKVHTDNDSRDISANPAYQKELIAKIRTSL